MKIEFRKQIDSDAAPWQPLTNIDELIWNGVFTLRVTDDDGSHNLPFRFANDDILTIVVKDHTPNAALPHTRTTLQEVTHVECATGKAFIYTRTRHTVDGVHIWSRWIADTELPVATRTFVGGIMIGDGLSINAEGRVSVDGKTFDGNNFDKVNLAIYTNALNSQFSGNLFNKNAAGILVESIFSDALGGITGSTTHNVTDYIAVVPGETYSCSHLDKNPFGYDLDKNFVTAIEPSGSTIIIPEGVYWIRVSYHQGWADTFCINKGTIILPVEERTFGLIRTDKLYGNAVTIDKLSHDVQVLIDEVPSFGLKLIKLAGFGTMYGGSTGVTGNGQYFVSTYDKKLYVSSNFVSPNSFTTTEVPFIDGAIYTYNNELYVYNGTEVVKAAAPLEKKVDNIFTDYAAITNGIPSMDTIAKTFTIPQGAYISAAGKGYVSLSNEIIVEPVGSNWSTQYIVFHLDYFTPLMECS